MIFGEEAQNMWCGQVIVVVAYNWQDFAEFVEARELGKGEIRFKRASRYAWVKTKVRLDKYIWCREPRHVRGIKIKEAHFLAGYHLLDRHQELRDTINFSMHRGKHGQAKEKA